MEKRQFLFRFAVDRRNYARRVRDTAKRFDFSVVDYIGSLAEHVVVGPRSIEAVHSSPSHVGEEEASHAPRLSARQSDLLWHL